MAIKVTFLIRRDTAANWTSVNPVLKLGEPGIETDTRRIKYGDGSTAWTSLDYASVPMPAGGTTGQILQKFSNNDFEFTWSSLTAGIVSFTPTGTISATNVQAAIAELGAEKVQGPGASTDQAIVRWNGTGGFEVLSSGVVIDGSDNITGAATITVDDDVYSAGWNGSLQVPTKNALYDKIESIVAGVSGLIEDTGTYVEIKDGSGNVTGQLGGTGDPGNYWNNTTHYFRSRDGSTTYISFGSTLFTSNIPISVPGDAYGGGWNGSTQVPTKDALYDKIDAMDTTIAGKLTGAPIDSGDALIPSLNSPWINYGGGFGGARYYKDACGIVHIEGLIQAPGGSSTSGVTLFTLLAGYRPPDTLMFVTYNGGGAGRIDVDSAGNVVMQSGNTAFTSLSGISFVPA